MKKLLVSMRTWQLMLTSTIMHQWESIFTWYMWFWLFAGYWQRNKWTQAFREHSRPIGGNRVSKTVHIGQHLHWSTRNFYFKHFYELAYIIKAPERHPYGFCLLKEIMTRWIYLIQLIPCCLPVQAPIENSTQLSWKMEAGWVCDISIVTVNHQ